MGTPRELELESDFNFRKKGSSELETYFRCDEASPQEVT